MDELPEGLQEEVLEYEGKISRFCPYCKSHRIESMGFREGNDNVRRYRCKMCGKSHSRDVSSNEVLRLKNMDKTSNKNNNRANKTLNVQESTKKSIESLRLYDRETIDDILVRLVENYDSTKPN